MAQSCSETPPETPQESIASTRPQQLNQTIDHRHQRNGTLELA